MSATSALREDAAIYVRLSKDDQLKGYSPEGMLTDCRDKCAALGFNVVAELIESGKGDDWDLVELWQALELAETGRITVLMAWDTSRLARDLGKRLWIKHTLGKHGARLRYARIEFDDTPEGEAQENMMGVFDQYEKARIKMRTALGIKTKLAKKIPICNGRVNYGYEPIYDEDTGRKVGYRPKDPEATVLRGIVRALETEPLQKICQRLNGEGVPTPDAARQPHARWGPATIRSLLKKTIYVGEYQFGALKRERKNGRWSYRQQDTSDITTIVDPARIVPLFTRAELDRARAAMATRRKRRRPRTAEQHDPYSLRGRLTCGHCGGALSTSISKTVRTYTCLRHIQRKTGTTTLADRCPMPAIPAEPLERYVWDALLDATSDPEEIHRVLLDASTASEAHRRHDELIETISATIRKLEQRIDRATDDIHDAPPGSRTATYARDKRAEYERELGEYRRSLLAAEAQAPSGLTLHDVAELEQELADIHEGMALSREEPDPPGERAIYRRLDLTVTLAKAAEGTGVKLGRVHWWSVAYDGLIRVRDNGNEPQGSYLLLRTAGRDGGRSWSVASAGLAAASRSSRAARPRARKYA